MSARHRRSISRRMPPARVWATYLLLAVLLAVFGTLLVLGGGHLTTPFVAILANGLITALVLTVYLECRRTR